MGVLLARTLTSQGTLTISDTPLGKGGEGSVYSVLSHKVDDLPEPSSMVAKLYHDPEEGNRAAKVVSMLRMPPHTTSAAWPVAVIARNGKFAGYLMRKLENNDYRSWAELSNTKDRRTATSEFDVRYAIAACRNLAASIHSIHDAGHMIGDINESNIFVGTDSSIFIVDTDSAQILGKDGKVFPCLVGKPEYTAAEISRGSLKDHLRTVETDVFGYAVAVHQMLTGGSHPTDGIYTNKHNDPPATIEKIREGILPGLQPNKNRDYKTAARIPTNAIPEPLKALLIKALQPTPTVRPSFEKFIEVFDEILKNLKQCSNVHQHWFDSRDGGCGWCEHLEAGNPDPWSLTAPKKTVAQVSLPSVSFNTENIPMKKARRVAPTVNGNSSNNNQSTQQQQVPHNVFNRQNIQNPSQVSSLNAAPNNTDNSGQQQDNEPEEDSIPRKHKGKMVLEYADGSFRVRPSLISMFQNSPKMAWYCLKEETPSFMKIWWDGRRKIASIAGLAIGFTLSLVVSTIWLYLIPETAAFIKIPEIFSFISEDLKNTVFGIFAIVSSMTALLASGSLLVSALRDRGTASKQYNGLQNLKQEKVYITVLRFIPISIFYGPILLVIIICALIWGLISLVFKVISQPKF